jgi:hypothetical protein
MRYKVMGVNGRIIRVLKTTTMSQNQKNQVKSILNFILIIGIVCGAIISPCIAKPAPRIACKLEVERLLGEWQNVDREYAIQSASLMPEHPVIIDLNKKKAKLNILLSKNFDRCFPLLANDRIIPGKRLGPITQKITYQNLIDGFDEDSLINRDFSGSEGEVTLPSTTIHILGVESFTIVWKNKQRNAPLQVFTTVSAFKTVEGIHVGMTFPELQKIIGEFQISGIEWDYGNQIFINKNRWKTHFNRLSISIALPALAFEKFPKDYRAVSGETYTSSSNPHWKNLEPYVNKISVSF